METVSKDFKKWITFNNNLTDHQHLYDLYSVIKDVKATNEYKCTPVTEGDSAKYFVQSASVKDVLEISGDERETLLSYLRQYYFQTENVEAWLREKQSMSSKSIDTAFTKSMESVLEVKPHNKEAFYYNIKLAFSVVVYLSILTMIVLSFVQSLAQGIGTIFILGSALLSVFALQFIIKGFIVGIIKGNAVRVTEHQYPLIYQIVKEQCQQLELKEMPQVYIGYGFFNAFVMKFAGSKVLMLYSEVVETALNGDENVLRFVIGHELGHVKRKHLTKNSWLFVAGFLPFLSNAYSRGCEYTCDRIGFHFSPKGAVHGILILATGKELYTKISPDHFVNDSVNSGSFWMWLSEKFLSHPHTSKRLGEIRAYAEYHS